MSKSLPQGCSVGKQCSARKDHLLPMDPFRTNLGLLLRYHPFQIGLKRKNLCRDPLRRNMRIPENRRQHLVKHDVLTSFAMRLPKGPLTVPQKGATAPLGTHNEVLCMPCTQREQLCPPGPMRKHLWPLSPY